MLEDSASLRPATAAAGAARRRGLRLGRLNLEVRQDLATTSQAAILAGSVLVGIAISTAILVLAGVPAGDLFDEFVLQTILDAESLHAVLVQAAPLILVGVGAAMAFRVSFWNLGIEGQMIWGGIAATAISTFQVGPPGLRLPLMIAMALVAGAAWALLAAALKFQFRVNEIISTLLLNYVSLYFLDHLLFGAWKDPKDSFPHSPIYAPFERLPDMGGVGSALPAALLLVAILWWLTRMTRAGLYMKLVLANPRMARAMGVPIAAVTLGAVAISGAMAALAGFAIAAGQEGRLTETFFSGYGFSGILVAFLARNNPVVASVVALLVAVLFVAGQNLQVFYQIPFAMVQLIQAILVMCVAASEFLIRHRLRWMR